MAAMRDLAEQIHGLKVEGNTTVIDLMVQNDTFRGIVSGTIRGARTVRINPTGSDTYEVLLEIDKETLSYLLRQARSVAKKQKNEYKINLFLLSIYPRSYFLSCHKQSFC